MLHLWFLMYLTSTGKWTKGHRPGFSLVLARSSHTNSCGHPLTFKRPNYSLSGTSEFLQLCNINKQLLYHTKLNISRTNMFLKHHAPMGVIWKHRVKISSICWHHLKVLDARNILTKYLVPHTDLKLQANNQMDKPETTCSNSFDPES